MRNSIRTKLYGAFAIVLALTLVLAGTAIVSLQRVRARYDNLLDRDAALKALAYRLRADVSEQASSSRAYLLTGDERFRDAFDAARQRYLAVKDTMNPLIDTQRGRNLADQAFEAAEIYNRVAVNNMAFRRANPTTPLPVSDLNRAFAAEQSVESLTNQVAEFKEELMATDRDAAVRDYHTTLFWLIAVSVLAALLAAGLGFWLSAGLIGPILALTRGAERVAAGDFSTRVVVPTRDETARLADAFNGMTANLDTLVTSERRAKARVEDAVHTYLAFVDQVGHGDLTGRLDPEGEDELADLGRGLDRMVASLRELAVQITQATNDMAAASTEILAAAAQQTSSASEQSSAVQETTTAVEEVRRMVSHAEGRAREVLETARHAADVAAGGQHAVEETIGGMHSIREQVQSIANNLLGLSERTQRIDAIVGTVNDITEQSRLLALNASIEAARAGEQGRGFAVVADEVRNLTEQSGQATRQVRTILEEIRGATNTAVMAAEQGTRGVDDGVQRAERTGETIHQLAESVQNAAAAMESTAHGAEQETAGVQQIAAAMSDIQRATAQALASTREAERAAGDLSRLARDLKDLAAHYRV